MNSSRQILYIADDNEIRSLDPGVPNWRYEQTFQGDASVRIDAMDLHVKTNRIFWTNWHRGQISSYELPGPPTSSSSGSSPNSHRNRRQSEGRVSNLQVSPRLKGVIQGCLEPCLLDCYMTCVHTYVTSAKPEKPKSEPGGVISPTENAPQ